MRAQRKGWMPQQLQVTNPPSPTPERPVPPPAAHFFCADLGWSRHRTHGRRILLSCFCGLMAEEGCSGQSHHRARTQVRILARLNNFEGTLAGSVSRPTTEGTEMKKGAGASPLFKLTPQKPNPSRGSGPATPGSQSHMLTVKRAIVVPAVCRARRAQQTIDF